MGQEQHHYVPRFLLKNFTGGKKPKIFVYDKWTGKRFQTNVKNVAAEANFYDLEHPGGRVSMESALGSLESMSASVVSRLLRFRDLNVLAEGDAATLTAFLAVQFVRTKEYRLRYEHLTEMVKDHLRKMGASEEEIKRSTGGPPNIEEDKLLGLTAISRGQEFIPHLTSKAWVLYSTPAARPFYISDNPIALHNQIDHSPYGNLGLGVRGIEIYFPLASTLCLGLLCPSIAEQFECGGRVIRRIDRERPGLADTLMTNAAATPAFCTGAAAGTPIEVSESNVTMMNSLQVTFSSRYVYCERDSFALVERMIEDNAKFRHALRPQL